MGYTDDKSLRISLALVEEWSWHYERIVFKSPTVFTSYYYLFDESYVQHIYKVNYVKAKMFAN